MKKLYLILAAVAVILGLSPSSRAQEAPAQPPPTVTKDILERLGPGAVIVIADGARGVEDLLIKVSAGSRTTGRAFVSYEFEGEADFDRETVNFDVTGDLIEVTIVELEFPGLQNLKLSRKELMQLRQPGSSFSFRGIKYEFKDQAKPQYKAMDSDVSRDVRWLLFESEGGGDTAIEIVEFLDTSEFLVEVVREIPLSNVSIQSAAPGK